MRYNLAFVCVSGIDSGLKIICLFSFLFVEWIFADFRLYYYKMRYNLASEPVCRGTRYNSGVYVVETLYFYTLGHLRHRSRADGGRGVHMRHGARHRGASIAE